MTTLALYTEHLCSSCTEVCANRITDTFCIIPSPQKRFTLFVQYISCVAWKVYPLVEYATNACSNENLISTLENTTPTYGILNHFVSTSICQKNVALMSHVFKGRNIATSRSTPALLARCSPCLLCCRILCEVTGPCAPASSQQFVSIHLVDGIKSKSMCWRVLVVEFPFSSGMSLRFRLLRHCCG